MGVQITRSHLTASFWGCKVGPRVQTHTGRTVRAAAGLQLGVCPDHRDVLPRRLVITCVHWKQQQAMAAYIWRHDSLTSAEGASQAVWWVEPTRTVKDEK